MGKRTKLTRNFYVKIIIIVQWRGSLIRSVAFHFKVKWSLGFWKIHFWNPKQVSVNLSCFIFQKQALNGFQKKKFFDQLKWCHYGDTNQVHNPQKCHLRVVPQSSLHNKSQIALNIVGQHWKARTSKIRTKHKGRKKRKTLKIEPINKSNAKRIINNNWFENYGATVPFWVVFRVPGLKKRWKRAVQKEKSRDATWQRLVDVWWLQWLCCWLFELI